MGGGPQVRAHPAILPGNGNNTEDRLRTVSVNGREHALRSRGTTQILLGSSGEGAPSPLYSLPGCLGAWLVRPIFLRCSQLPRLKRIPKEKI